MTISDWIITAFAVLWIGEFLFFRSRKSNASANEESSKSFPTIFLAVLLAIVISLLSRESGVASFPFPGSALAGAVLFAMGILLRYWGIRELGKQFTRGLHVQDGDKVVSSGPFRYLRHPLYTGLFTAVFGFVLYTASLAGFFIAAAGFLPLLLKRIRSEETLLTDTFGAEYQNWAKQRYRLFPYIY
ncbi:methyltransferase family protein [Salisediminibacterium halotolerans]|uniref:methyltransferase family protein n=1 Tax=Salisediminibacterium halotolerans TaxID=517425 RepID=UPI000EB4EB82|nr:isoprenylcysteine carboxylmethyltransferase family protein [Salisediminibacterium halotolerans]RLJ75452.1 protein-S-isoprenylcysteine O-methyltransferase Ste14 [Actinophytocola xinjiangensis]RPE89305.1 protein-S-isoprenylcysteine O-methyltransferase Ste14 [Salisediminibacterium halotolerans]TWG36065.1 protein-S-isoprenylcysteine O-methyltransferase Ste14 [Salisediminibacterium halotolerans]GEL07828.1 isoprenylcysteine carboxyl methyltransferase [Salisediminibacterium halotolerans]